MLGSAAPLLPESSRGSFRKRPGGLPLAGSRRLPGAILQSVPKYSAGRFGSCRCAPGGTRLGHLVQLARHEPVRLRPRGRRMRQPWRRRRRRAPFCLTSAVRLPTTGQAPGASRWLPSAGYRDCHL